MRKNDGVEEEWMLLRSQDQRHREKRSSNCCLPASQKSLFLLKTRRVFLRTVSLELLPLQAGVERSLEEVHITGSSAGCDGGLRICRKHRRSNQILLFVLAKTLKYQ